MDDKSSPTTIAVFSLWCFIPVFTGKMRKNLKIEHDFISKRNVSVGFIITDTHEIESEKNPTTTFNHLKYNVGFLHDNHEINDVDKIKITFKQTHLEDSHQENTNSKNCVDTSI